MKQDTWKKALFLGGIALGVVMAVPGNVKAAKKKNYTVNAKTIAASDKLRTADGYNKYTKQYYMLRSYLEKLEKNGGGTLTLKKGKYKIPCTLYVPSNVTIKLKSGVKLVKTNKTGSKKLKTSKYMFQLVSQGKTKKKKKVTAYKASKNVSFIGSGTVTMDLGKIKGAVGIYSGHANKITIQNVRFKNRYGGNYVWIEGSKNVKVTKCKFYKGTATTGVSNQIALRLETINATTNAFTGKWSKYDNTPNANIQIDNNYFYNVETCIGSAKYVSPYVKGKTINYYQTSIKVTNNVFSNPRYSAVYAMGWSGATISGNTMKMTTAGTKIRSFIYGYGVYNPMISGNTLNGCEYAMIFGTAANSGSGSNFAKLASTIGSTSVAKFYQNTVKNITHYYIVNDTTRVMYFRNTTDKNFTITTSSAPYREKFTEQSNYSTKKYYYIFRSYMEQLEYTGGGTITVEAGTYNITNNICIPSNVTVNLKNGVVLNKSGTTATDICYAKSIFTIVPPSKDGTKKTISGYNGSHDVKIIGNGTVKLDCTNVLNAMAIVMGHAKNVTISGLTFLNEYGSHFIELNSSNNVTLSGCTFRGFKPYEQKSYKECINVDGTDENTNGFNYDWSTHDKTTCNTIKITNNKFYDIGTAVGSHTYSANGTTQLYHENVEFTGNTVDGTYNAAIRALNWRNPVVKNNIFKNNQSLADGKMNEKNEQTKYVTLFFRGVVNPSVSGNTFDTSEYYPIRITQIVAAVTDESALAGYPNTVSEVSDANLEEMKKNTLKNIPDKYHFILVKEDSDVDDKDATKTAFIE